MKYKPHKLLHVDACTTTPLQGNPCAVVFDADDIYEEDMLLIAKEMNLSETSFILKSEKADFKVRYYTPAEEIPMAGAPTIGTVHALIEEGLIPISTSRVSIELQIGVIEIEIKHGGTSPLITMQQLPPQFLNTYKAIDIAALFSLAIGDIDQTHPIQTVSTGTPFLMIPVHDIKTLEKIRFQPSMFKDFRDKSDFLSAHIFCSQGMSPQGDSFARHFSAPPEPAEDSYTGSATGAMACYLRHYGLIKKNEIIAEQGHLMGRPGIGIVDLSVENNAIKAVKFSGRAVTVLKGTLF